MADIAMYGFVCITWLRGITTAVFKRKKEKKNKGGEVVRTEERKRKWERRKGYCCILDGGLGLVV